MSSLSLYSTVGKTSWFTLQGYYAENFPSYRMKRHSHKRIEVMYAVSGSFFIEMRCKEKWKAMPIRLGEMIVIDSEAPHSLLIPAGGEARILNLEMEVNHDNMTTFNMGQLCAVSEGLTRMMKDAQPYLKIVDNHDVQKIIHSIHQELQLSEVRQDTESGYMRNLLLAQFWIAVGRCYKERRQSGSLYSYVKRALEYVDAHFCNDITVEEIADYAGIHCSYLQRIFKENIGFSLMSYVNKVRIERACYLLLNSELSIEKIAAESGFNNRQNFGYMFKRMMNVTPREYRTNEANDNMRVFYSPEYTNKIEE